MSRTPLPGMKTADQLEAETDPDFVTDGKTNHCRYCGVIKDATSAKFFVDHHRECVEPRKRERT